MPTIGVGGTDLVEDLVRGVDEISGGWVDNVQLELDAE